MWVGPNLLSFQGGQEIVASVIAHEIGHNLGLTHITEANNLMQPGGSANAGQCFNSTQISTVLSRASQAPILLSAVPEPSAMLCVATVSLLVVTRPLSRLRRLIRG